MMISDNPHVNVPNSPSTNEAGTGCVTGFATGCALQRLLCSCALSRLLSSCGVRDGVADGAGDGGADRVGEGHGFPTRPTVACVPVAETETCTFRMVDNESLNSGMVNRSTTSKRNTTMKVAAMAE